MPAIVAGPRGVPRPDLAAVHLRTPRARDTAPTAGPSTPPRDAGPALEQRARTASGSVSSIVPTSVRTMCRRNESAVTVKWSSSPRRSHPAARISRRNTSCRVSVGVNAVKSCSPRSAAAHASSASSSTRPRPPERTARAERRRARAGRGRRTGTSAPIAENRAWKPSGASSAATTATSSGQRRVERLRAAARLAARPLHRGWRPDRLHGRRRPCGRRRRGRSTPAPRRRAPRARRPPRSARPAAAPSRGTPSRRTRASA